MALALTFIVSMPMMRKRKLPTGFSSARLVVTETAKGMAVLPAGSGVKALVVAFQLPKTMSVSSNTVP